MLKSPAVRAAAVAIGANVVLLAIKGAASLYSDSLTIFSETVNSLTDVLASVVILICVRWAMKSPDEDHPFGHQRAEPIAAFTVAFFMVILGFEICRKAFFNFREGHQPETIGVAPLVALGITIGIKTLLSFYFWNKASKLRSPALKATAIDCRNDVIIALQGLIGVSVALGHFPVMDTIAAFFVGGYILFGGYCLCIENLGFLMGRAPDQEMIEEINTAASSVDGVHKIDNIRAHYVGTFVHVELTARVDGQLSTAESHGLCEKTRAAVESLELVDRAFVHISTVK